MVSQEFRSAIASHNLLRTRIMLKDSFVVDPTFGQLKAMLDYAKQIMPELFVPFDGDTLEDDPTKWNQEVMNMELVQLVNNFSETRITHLQKVVSKVMAAEIQKANAQKSQPPYQRPLQNSTTQPGKKYSTSSQYSCAATNMYTSGDPNTKALQQIMTEYTKISRVLQEVKDTKKWNLLQINELETAAKRLLQATQTYKANRQK